MGYADVLDHRDEGEYERLSRLAEEADKSTLPLLQALRPRPDWRCLEIGAGIGTVARWMARQCPDGQVVATDLDTGFLERSSPPGVRVLRHDVTSENFPPASFDLIFARAVFMHLPGRERTLAKVVSWLKPGGRLMLCDGTDLASPTSPHPLHRKLNDAIWHTLAEMAGTDPDWARSFPQPLANAGLERLGLDAFTPIVGPGTPYARFMIHTVRRLKEPLLASGRVTEADIGQALEDYTKVGFWDLATFAGVYAWGYRPTN